MIYQSNLATTDNQELTNSTLNSLLTTLQDFVNGATENSEIAALNSIISALAPLATAANQNSANTTLSSILSALAPLATAANQSTANTTLTSILTALSGAATAAKQDTGNTSLASIDSKMGSSTGTITSVSQTTSSVSLLSANPNRRGMYLYNNTGQKVYVAFSGTASTSAFTLLLAANVGYESPQSAVYKGVVSAVWAGNGNGAMLVTEMT